MDDRIATARKGIRVMTDNMMEDAVSDSLKTARLLREEWAAIGTLKKLFPAEAPDAIASCPERSTAGDMAKNLLCAVGCDVRRDKSSTSDTHSANDQEVDDEATITEYGSEPDVNMADFDDMGDEDVTIIEPPQRPLSPFGPRHEVDNASAQRIQESHDIHHCHYDIPLETAEQRNTSNHGSGESFRGTLTRVNDDSSSAAELVQPQPTVTQPQQSGQQMVPDALTGCSPAPVRHDTSNSDWRESFFGGVSQPPVRRAAAKAMIRMESQRCSPLETVQVAAGVGGDGRPWVDHRATNTSSRGGGGCGGGCGGGGDGGSPSGGVEEISHDMSPFNMDSCDIESSTVGGRDMGARAKTPTTTDARPKSLGRLSAALVATSTLPGSRIQHSSEKAFNLDPRLFVYAPAGSCRARGCVFWKEAHCHRGPACDCARNRDAYTIPKDMERILQHQKWHLERNNKPAIGERVLVKFHDKVWYKGTINARVGSSTEGKHEWSVLFDDCTTDTFVTGETDVSVSNQPLPRELDCKLERFYRKQTNGGVLLIKDVRARHAAIQAIENSWSVVAGSRSSPTQRVTQKTNETASASSATWGTQK